MSDLSDSQLSSDQYYHPQMDDFNSERGDSASEPSPRVSSPNTKRSVVTSSIKGLTISIMKNAYPRGSAKRYRALTMEKLLLESMEILGLNNKGKFVFDENGVKITQIDQLQEGATYYISTGEKFGHGVTPPEKRKVFKSPPKPVRQEPIESPKSAKSNSTKISRSEQEMRSFNYIVATSAVTSEEAVNISSASLFDSLQDKQKSYADKNQPELRCIRDETRQGLFVNHLVENKIVPSSLESVLIPEMEDWAIDLLNESSTNDLKYLVSGPPGSGKTSVLYILSTIISRKISTSVESDDYFYFPFNFALNSNDLFDPISFLKIYMKTTFEALTYNSLGSYPYIPQLRTWFFSFVNNQSQPPFPTIPNADNSKLQQLGKKVSAVLRANDDQSLINFVKFVCNFPAEIAGCFGLKPIYIFESLDSAYIAYVPTPKLFPFAVNQQVIITDYLSKTLDNALFIVDLTKEKLLLDVFKCKDALLIDTERIVNGFSNVGDIVVKNPNIRLTIKDCIGCPAFVGKYLKLAKLVQSSKDNMSRKGLYSSIKATADLSRKKILKQELEKFCSLLRGAENKNLSLKNLNQLIETDDIQIDLVKRGQPGKWEDEKSVKSSSTKNDGLNQLDTVEHKDNNSNY